MSQTITLPQLYSYGHALDMDESKVGFLRDSSDASTDFDELRRRFSDEGYLSMRGYLDRDEVLAARASLTERLGAAGVLDPAYPAIDGVCLPGSGYVFKPEITDGNEIIKLGTREMHARAYVAAFNFRGPDQQKKVGVLSGGERNRVHLAKVLKSGGNVLLLDEPTNDLDVDTLRALEAGLEAFPGCAVVISHDRWFLDRIATHVLAFEGDSVVRWFEGNFSEYEEYKKRELGENVEQPHRIKYKKLG